MNTRFFLTLCCFMSLGACSSRTQPQKTPSEAVKGWDYNQVRKARSAEQDQDAVRPPAKGPETTLDCVMMSAVQKAQSRASGCRKMDSRLGYGEDTFCCDRN
ncbi:MAG: hypothetical protein ABIR96_10100 [Bdellovibrionota bacterium]